MEWKGMEYWDVEFRLSAHNAQLFLRGLLQCKGHAHDGCAFNYYKSADLVVWRISLPVGAAETFEFITGLNLTPAPEVRGT